MALDAGGRGGGRTPYTPRKNKKSQVTEDDLQMLLEYGFPGSWEQIQDNLGVEPGSSNNSPTSPVDASGIPAARHMGKLYGDSYNFGPKPKNQDRNRPPVADEGGDPLDALYGFLQSSASPTFDYESALAESEKAIRDAYGAEIGAIRRGNRGARKQTARDRAELERMYNALGRSYERAGRRDARQGERLANRMSDQSERSAGFLKKNADKMLSEQAARAENLGVEAAVPENSAGLVGDVAAQSRKVIRQGASDANRQRGFAGNNRRFMNRGAQGARLEGTNRSADLLADLQDYLQANRDKIAGLRGDRNRELASNESAVMSSVAEMQQSANSDMWDQLMDLANLDMDREKFAHEQQMDLADLRNAIASGGSDPQNQFPGLESVGNAQHYLGQMQNKQMGASLYDSLMRSDVFRRQKVRENGQEFKLTPQEASYRAEQIAEENGLSVADKNLLALAIMAGLG